MRKVKNVISFVTLIGFAGLAVYALLKAKEDWEDDSDWDLEDFDEDQEEGKPTIKIKEEEE